jgi:uncharacterized protein YbjQ (UPF0145 family)
MAPQSRSSKSNGDNRRPGCNYLRYIFGRAAEKRHYRSIKQRELDTIKTPAVSFRSGPIVENVESATLATGSVVIAIDAFKKFLSAFVGIFGGEMHSYSSLFDRARREAVLPMKESQPTADAFVNVRVETSTIAGKRHGTSSCVEVLAFGTALRYKQ